MHGSSQRHAHMRLPQWPQQPHGRPAFRVAHRTVLGPVHGDATTAYEGPQFNSRTQGAKSESIVHCNLRFVFPRPVQTGARSALDKVVA